MTKKGIKKTKQNVQLHKDEQRESLENLKQSSFWIENASTQGIYHPKKKKTQVHKAILMKSCKFS